MTDKNWKDFFGRTLSGFSSLALAIVFYFLILRLGEIVAYLKGIVKILMPFLYGGMMAFLLKAPCNALEVFLCAHLPGKAKKYASGLAVTGILILVFFVMYLLLSLVIPELMESAKTLFSTVQSGANMVGDWVLEVTAGSEILHAYAEDTIGMVRELLSNVSGLTGMLQSVVEGFASTVGTVVVTLYDLVVGVIVCVYMLADRKGLARHAKAVLYAMLKPHHADALMNELEFVDRTFVGFFNGKILDSVIVGVICFMFCWIMSVISGFPNALLVSVIVGVCNIIPYFGPFVGAAISALIVVSSGFMNLVFFLIFIVILQQIDGNIIGPKLLADRVGLSGFWVLFAITFFGGLFGFVGILLGVPVFAVIYDLIRRFIMKGLERHDRRNILDESEP